MMWSKTERKDRWLVSEKWLGVFSCAVCVLKREPSLSPVTRRGHVTARLLTGDSALVLQPQNHPLRGAAAKDSMH